MNTESEQGTVPTSTRTTRRRGYCAGDFSTRPFPSPAQLHELMTMRVPAGVGVSW